MMTFFLFLLLLDFQRPVKPDDAFSKFVVTDTLDNSATTGCTMSPSSGVRANADMISVDWVNHNNPHEGETAASRLATSQLTAEAPMVMPYDPPGLPDPNPEPPPAVATPEPPTLAILTISGVVLLFLLFGRKRQKLHRRTR